MSNHKQDVKDTFDKASGQYDEMCGFFFNHFGKGLVSKAQDLKGKKVLDVATGRGAVLFPLVDAGAQIDAIDLSSEMISLVQNEAKKRGYNDINFSVMDAEKLDFPENTFDFVFCGFAVFFCDSIEGVLNEFRRVLKPGGTVALSTWGDDSPLDEWISKKRAALEKKKLISSSFWNEGEIKEALMRSQFRQIEIYRESKLFHYRSPEVWWESLKTHGTRYFLDQLNDIELSDIRDKAISFASQFVTNEGVEELNDVFYAFARK